MTVSSALMGGAMLGLSVAAPFGPVSLMCVQRSMTTGRNSGLISGVGAASAHGLFALAALVGAGAISARLTDWGHPLRQLSAIVLIGLGIRSWRRLRSATDGRPSATRRAMFSSTLVLALSNPMTILPYAAVASAVASGEAPLSPWSVLGVLSGAMVWYACLSVGSAYFGKGLSARATRRLDQLAGTCFILIGAILLTS